MELDEPAAGTPSEEEEVPQQPLKEEVPQQPLKEALAEPALLDNGLLKDEEADRRLAAARAASKAAEERLAALYAQAYETGDLPRPVRSP